MESNTTIDFRQHKAEKKRKVGRPKAEVHHAMSSGEISRRNSNAYAMIDDQLNEARGKINWERRRDAERDIVSWVNTYCIHVLLDDPPPPKCQEILREMFSACMDSRPYLICQARGSGKTSYIECVVSYCLATGIKKFPVIISHNATASQNILNDIFRLVSDDGTAFSTDYPDISLPFIICNGAYRRIMTFNGTPVQIHKTGSKMVFARLIEKDGSESPTSNSCIDTRGITSGIRGLKHNTLRPDLAVLDDLQDEETAESPDRVQKLMDIINKSVLNIGGKGKISVLQAGTPICPDDLIEQLCSDTAWKVSKFPAIISFPTDWIKDPGKGLWGQYFELYDAELATDSTHEKSLQFYMGHRAEMDSGSDILNPDRFKESDGHVSALQALMDKMHQIGTGAFFSEYQMQPKRVSLEVQLVPKQVIQHISPNVDEGVVPDGHSLTVCSIDLNTSYGATAVAVSFKTDSSSSVIKHKIFKLSIDQKVTDIRYDQLVYTELCKIVKKIKEWNIQIDCLGIDCGGKNWNVVTEFCKNCQTMFGIPACAMAGKASTNFNPLARNRLREAIGRTVLCGDEKERVKKGSGQKWIWFDSDYFREYVQKSFSLENGSVGSCSLYNDHPTEHVEFSVQICNETLLWKKQKTNGQEYRWKSKEPHDFLDCMAMCYAISTNQGITTQKILKKQTSDQGKRAIPTKLLVRRKKKIKIV